MAASRKTRDKKKRPESRIGPGTRAGPQQIRGEKKETNPDPGGSAPELKTWTRLGPPPSRRVNYHTMPSGKHTDPVGSMTHPVGS